MSGLMKILGTLLVIAAVVFVLMLKLSSAQMQVWGISPDVVATLLVGGILSLGLAGVMDAVSRTITNVATQAEAPAPVAEATALIVEPVVDDKMNTLPKMGFGRKRVEPTPPPTTENAGTPVAKVLAATSVADTIAALEQAKSDIKTALGGVESMTSPVEESKPVSPLVAEMQPEPAAEVADESEELYVVEEKIIRGRPSRILSDDTVEAETDEGWMRFENLEHLNEYLDSVEEADA
jgi:hypothetical protein